MNPIVVLIRIIHLTYVVVKENAPEKKSFLSTQNWHFIPIDVRMEMWIWKGEETWWEEVLYEEVLFVYECIWMYHGYSLPNF